MHVVLIGDMSREDAKAYLLRSQCSQHWSNDTLDHIIDTIGTRFTNLNELIRVCTPPSENLHGTL